MIFKFNSAVLQLIVAHIKIDNDLCFMIAQQKQTRVVHVTSIKKHAGTVIPKHGFGNSENFSVTVQTAKVFSAAWLNFQYWLR